MSTSVKTSHKPESTGCDFGKAHLHPFLSWDVSGRQSEPLVFEKFLNFVLKRAKMAVKEWESLAQRQGDIQFMFDTAYKFGKYNPIPQSLGTRRWLNTPLFLRGINQQMKILWAPTAGFCSAIRKTLISYNFISCLLEDVRSYTKSNNFFASRFWMLSPKQYLLWFGFQLDGILANGMVCISLPHKWAPRAMAAYECLF